jgi:iron complex outermembrane receptor protein
LTIYQTGFESYYDQFQEGVAMYLANGTSETPEAGSAYTLDSRGGLTSATSMIYTGWQPLACPTGTTNCAWAGGDTGYSKGGNRTSDLAEGFQWDATDRLYVTGAFQYVHSTSNTNNNDVFPETAVPSFSITTHGNGLPVVTVPNAASLNNPALYIWEAAMDHIAIHNGSQLAGNVDAKYEVSDGGFLRAVKFGLRYANMTEMDQDGGYSWNGITPPWSSPIHYVNQPQNNGRPGEYYLETFSNFFRGKATLPFEQIEPTLAMVEAGTSFIHQQYGNSGDNTGPQQLYPYEKIVSNTKTKDAYIMADFASNTVFGMPMDGNIGLRVVNNENASSGFSFQYPWTNAQSTAPGPYCGATPDPVTHLYKCSSPTSAGDPNNGVVATPSAGGRHYTKLLPSLNIQFMPTDSTHLRFAVSQTMSNPNFTQLAAGGNVSFQNCGGTGVFSPTCTANSPYTGYVGAPDLKPQVSTNVDLSAEWYGANQATLHVAAFYKSIDDYLEYGSFNVPTTVAEPNGSVTVANVLINNYYNAAKSATIKGVEIGGTKFMDFLPSPFDGLGIDANFTYIDSASPGDMSCQLFSAKAPAVNGPCGGEPITGLPVEQLSRYNYNLTAMYEKGPWSVRLAYNWRSKYLLVASGANGTKTLPVFSLPYGQLDFGASYKITDFLTLGIDGQNVLDSVAKTVDGYYSPQYGNQQYNRNWYVSDRRFIASLKFNF